MSHSEKPHKVKVVLRTALFSFSTDPQAKFNTLEAAKRVLGIYRSRVYCKIDTARVYLVVPQGQPSNFSDNLIMGLR